jgi:hypothetical protein
LKKADGLLARRCRLKTEGFDLDLAAERVVLVMGNQKYSNACAEASAS